MEEKHNCTVGELIKDIKELVVDYSYNEEMKTSEWNSVERAADNYSFCKKSLKIFIGDKIICEMKTPK